MRTFARPCGYIRRSVVRRDGDISKEYQIERVRALAGDDGPTLLIYDQDWGRSGGRAEARKRKAWATMLAAVEAGDISAIYAYSVDRLARDVEAGAHLLNECERVGIPIVTTEGRFAPGDTGARTLFHALGMGNESYSDQRKGTANLTIKVRRERGDHLGRVPYGSRYDPERKRGEPAKLVPNPAQDPSRVVEAFRQGGSFYAAARILNADPSMMPAIGRQWAPTTIRGIIEREAPEMLPLRRRARVRTRSDRPFSGLLRCPHAADLHPATPWMTSGPAKDAHGDRYRYICRTGQIDRAHPKPYIISERRVQAWATAYLAAELGKRLAVELEGQSPDDLAKIEALDARRDRVNDMYERGTITPAEYARRIAAIDTERPRLVASKRAVTRFQMRNRIDWNADGAEINAALRELWSEVTLDPTTLDPTGAIWNIGQGPAEIEGHDEWTEARAEYDNWYAPYTDEQAAWRDGATTEELRAAVAEAQARAVMHDGTRRQA